MTVTLNRLIHISTRKEDINGAVYNQYIGNFTERHGTHQVCIDRKITARRSTLSGTSILIEGEPIPIIHHSLLSHREVCDILFKRYPKEVARMSTPDLTLDEIEKAAAIINGE